jgi:hypothetical protein
MTGAPLITQYISTFTALPIGKPYTGLLQRDVSLQLEINNTVAKLIAGAKEINVRLVPVQLSGRTVPAIDLQLKSAVLNLLS